MNTKQLPLLKKLGPALLVLFFLLSCQKENATNNPLQENTGNLISLNEASAIAKRFLSTKTAASNPRRLALKSSVREQNQHKQIASIVSAPDDKGTTAFYVINYEDGGFLILSGDKRVEPILAWSETDSFPLENVEEFPSGLVQWLFSSKETIQDARSANLQVTEAVRNQWSSIINDTAVYAPNGNHPPLPETGDGCEGMENVVTIKGPLLTTEWNQGCGYNDVFPTMSCSPALPCGKAWTGCVATSMAQVMKYHEYPTSYNWIDMPQYYGTTTTSSLMKDVADAVDMNYQCNGSGADTKEDVASAFKNSFGYSTATYDDYDYQVVKSELAQNRPVILRGGRNTGWWIFGQYSDGHAWVCDGYESIQIPCYGGILRLHMNWGWGGSYNGYYGFQNFNPGDNTFNYKTGMVYNIKP